MCFIPDLEAIGQEDSIRRYAQATLVINLKGERLTTDALIVAIECDDLDCMRPIFDTFQERRVLWVRRQCLGVPKNRNAGFVVSKDIGRNRLRFAVLLEYGGWNSKTSTELAIYRKCKILDIRQSRARNLNPHRLTYTGTILRTGYLEWHLRRCRHRHRDCQTQDCRTQNRLDHRFASSLEPSPETVHTVVQTPCRYCRHQWAASSAQYPTFL